MDAVVYPSNVVQEVAKGFVAIRVEFKGNPEVVKQFGVQGLPDIRLLDSEGHPLAKLLGFTSATRLGGACQAVLDQLAGRPASAASGPGARRVRPSVDVAEAVRRGLDHLRAAVTAHPEPPGGGIPGEAEIVLYAWVAAGGTDADADFVRFRDRVLATPVRGTYQAAFRALALSRLDPAAHRQALDACLRFLLATQCENGQWSYGPGTAAQAQPAIGDNSNTAYALLGLAACRKAGLEVAVEPIRKADGWWRRTQNSDGGWGYRSDRESASYAGMTESGLGSLRLCQLVSGNPPEADAASARATEWLGRHFSVTESRESPYQQGRLLYHLYALERVGTLLGEREVAGHDWFAEGSRFLQDSQGEDGSWDDGADTPIANTAFALLFLTRATAALR